MTRLIVTVVLSACIVAPAGGASRREAREALGPLRALVGEWKANGPHIGSREEREKGFWQETAAWQWKFKGDTAWLRAEIGKGKHFTRFEIRPDGAGYELKAWPTGEKEPLSFKGKLEKNRLVCERADGKAAQQLTILLLHSNRYAYTMAVRPEGHAVFTERYKVWGTKQGVPFAIVDKGPECIVSGGLGTMTVTHKGKTYYVCCSGCRDAFRDDPEKYIKEHEESKMVKKE